MLSPHDECDYCDMCSLVQNESKWHALLAAAKSELHRRDNYNPDDENHSRQYSGDEKALRAAIAACAPPASGEEKP
jgi:hypothetical protein